ncbi:MAG: hypothetical protein ABFS38_08190 [Bacteroidota bacterium]
MKRRKFIKTAAAGSSILGSGGLLSLTQFTPVGRVEDSLINPIIPIQIFPNLEKEMLSYIIVLRKHYGFRRFVITGPSKEYRYTGFPEKQVFIDLGELILRFKRELAPHDIEIGWWCTTTIRIGKGDFQSIIRLDGTTAQEACCPLDPDYKKAFSDYVATIVQIAQPFWINFEDDFHMNHGCYCPRHLEEFAKREKHDYSREALQNILNEKSAESYRLRQSYGEMNRDSLAALAVAVREKVDQLAPETRICLCQSGASERDGNFTEAVTRALAGKTRPAVRLFGSSYFSDNPHDIPKSIFNCLYSQQHLPANFELLHESDSFPHTRFFLSGSKLKSLITAAYAYGLHESLLYVNQYLENPLEEDGYRDMFLKESKRFSALKQAVKDCRVDGCEIFRKPRSSSNWVHITGRLGIPHTSAYGKVKLVSGDIVERMTDEEIENLLQGSLFLDGHAAHLLSKKGFSKLIGAEVFAREDTLLPPFYEGVRNPENYSGINNRLMYNYTWAFNRRNKDAFYQIKSLSGTEIITDFLNTRNQPLYPAMIRFENDLGGRVAVMAFNLNDNYVFSRSISIFNYVKKELMRQTIEWLGKEPLPVFVKQIPNTFCIFNRSKSNDYAVVVITGLSSDSFDSISLDIAPEWINSRFELLNRKGIWEPIKAEIQNSTIKLNTSLSVMNPVILKFNK